jgi:chromosome segregation ATPase
MIATALASVSLSLLTPKVFAEQILYRYVDEQGIKVINYSIPAKYTVEGYEVISPSGQILKVVPPALTAEELEKKGELRKLQQDFALLQRRYASAEDMQAAKLRRLVNINTNISILKGNISGIKTRMANLMSTAADQERSGKQVSAQLLQQLINARAELAVGKSALNRRLEEYKRVSDKFDNDLVTYNRGLTVLGSTN